MNTTKLLAEGIGTALLVFFAVGVATLTFGVGLTGSSTSAGVLTTAMAFGLTLLVLAYALGPISGCHINPAVTMGFLAAGRIDLRTAAQYWAAQVVGGIAGALALWGVLSGSDVYDRDMGLGADGFGSASMVGLNATGAIIAEALLTFLFVFTVLAVTRKAAAASAMMAGAAIGFALTVVHLIGIPLTGTSVNPARSIGPALVVGDLALSQLWVFVLAPMIGGALAAVCHNYLFPPNEDAPAEIVLPDTAAVDTEIPVARRSGSLGGSLRHRADA
jgi:aquaporin Z